MTNRERMENIIRRFPSLTIKCSYKLKVEESNEQGESVSSDEGMEQVAKMIDCNENVNLLSLSTIVLTELTRAGTGLAFIRKCNRSLQGILITAMEVRCLICKTIGKETTPVEKFALGNVYLLSEDIPSDSIGNSTFITFLQDYSNEKRLKNKLKISTKPYMLEKENRVKTSSIEVAEANFEDDGHDIFVVPVERVVA